MNNLLPSSSLEILALILANQSNANNHGQLDDYQLRTSKATLIVVPSTLSSQWWREIKNNVDENKTTCTDFINISDQDKRITIGIEHVRLVRDKNRNMDYFKNRPYTEENAAAFDFGGEHIRNFCIEHGRTLGNVFVEVRLPFSTARGNCYVGKLMSINNVGRLMSNNVEKVDVMFDYEDLLWDHDIVLTTYESLKKHAQFYKKVIFHRIILDECQEIKVATTTLASQLANIKSTHRWMVSGTPLCTKIEDLHGELNFLKIIPFSLDNKKDGFWELKIGKPFREKNKSALQLLHALLDVVMIRHTKSQRYVDGRPLVSIVSRTIEYRGVQLQQSSERYLFAYLESFAADSLEMFLKEAEERNEENPQPLARLKNFNMIKGLLSLISKCLTHPSIVSLTQLDHLRRILTSTAARKLREQLRDDEHPVPLMSVEQILHVVNSVGAGAGGGMNRAGQREVANITMSKKLIQAREDYENNYTIKDLQKLFHEMDLPIPMVWQDLPFTASIDDDDKIMRVFYNKLSYPDRKKQPVLSQMIEASDLLRLKDASSNIYELQVDSITNEHILIGAGPELQIGSIETTELWKSDVIMDKVKIYKYTEASRKHLYIDLLIAKDISTSNPDSLLHETGSKVSSSSSPSSSSSSSSSS